MSIKGTKNRTKSVKIICRRVTGPEPLYFFASVAKKEDLEQIAGVFRNCRAGKRALRRNSSNTSKGEW